MQVFGVDSLAILNEIIWLKRVKKFLFFLNYITYIFFLIIIQVGYLHKLLISFLILAIFDQDQSRTALSEKSDKIDVSLKQE